MCLDFAFGDLIPISRQLHEQQNSRVPYSTGSSLALKALVRQYVPMARCLSDLAPSRSRSYALTCRSTDIPCLRTRSETFVKAAG